MEKISIWLPFPPSVNNLFPTNRRTGRRYPSKEYKAWQVHAGALINKARMKLIAEPVEIEIELTAKDGRPRDADNYAKPLLDILVKCGVLRDDSSKYVRRVSPAWCEHDKDEAGALVIINPLPAKEKPLSKSEKKAFESLREKRVFLLTPTEKPRVSMEKLVARGMARKIPGLLDEKPQGYEIAD